MYVPKDRTETAGFFFFFPAHLRMTSSIYLFLHSLEHQLHITCRTAMAECSSCIPGDHQYHVKKSMCLVLTAKI